VFAGVWSASLNERKVWEGKALSDFLKAGKFGLEKESGKTLKCASLISKMLMATRIFVCHPSVSNSNLIV